MTPAAPAGLVREDLRHFEALLALLRRLIQCLFRRQARHDYVFPHDGDVSVNVLGGVAQRLNTFGVDLPDRGHVIDNPVDLSCVFIQLLLPQVQAGQAGQVGNIFARNLRHGFHSSQANQPPWTSGGASIGSMSFLMRVRMPDTPGSLGLLAMALGTVGGDIRGVDIVGQAELEEPNTVVDDIVVSLPTGHLPDSLITATQELDGFFVDSIRPFSGTVDRRGQIQMLSGVAEQRRHKEKALEILMQDLPRTMTAGWAVVLETSPRTHRVAASPAAPEDNGQELDQPPLTEARVLNPEREDWITENWAVMNSALAGTPIDGTDLLLIVGRPGGPDFLVSEVEHLRQLGSIFGALFS